VRNAAQLSGRNQSAPASGLVLFRTPTAEAEKLTSTHAPESQRELLNHEGAAGAGAIGEKAPKIISFGTVDY
jgi:hypothetical protein